MDCSSWTKRHQFLPVTSSNTPWNISFAYGVWQLWLSHKKRIFNPPSDTHNQMLPRTLHLSLEYFLLIHPRKSSIPKCILNISWQPPVDPFFTLNTDGRTLGNPGYAGGGGIIRDSQGRWIIGFPPHIGLTINNIVEHWAVQQRLYMAWDAGIIILNIEVDSTLVINCQTSPGDMAPALAPLICDCRILLDKKWTVCLNHTYCEVNRVADGLCKKGKGAKQPTENLFTLSIFCIL